MGLRFGSAGADRGPRDQVAIILWRNRVERLGAGRQADFGNVEQELAGFLHADVDAEAVVHERVVDIALPAHRGARLFEIDAHDQLQRVADFVGQRLEAAGVIEAGDRVVDRAGADDDEEARVRALENAVQRGAAMHDGVCGGQRQRQAAVDILRRRHGVEGGDVDVFDVDGAHGLLAQLANHVFDGGDLVVQGRAMAQK